MDFEDIFILPPDQPTTTMSSSSTTILAAIAAIIISYWLIRIAQYRYSQWSSNSVELAQRRRHGIPDSDKRPFQLAYNAAVSKRRPLVKPSRIPVHIQDRPALFLAVDPQIQPRDTQAKERGVYQSHRVDSYPQPKPTLTQTQNVPFPIIQPSAESNLANEESTADRRERVPQPKTYSRKRLHMDGVHDARPSAENSDAVNSLPKRARKADWSSDRRVNGDAPRWAGNTPKEPMRKPKRPAEDDGALEESRPKSGGKRARPTHKASPVVVDVDDAGDDDMHPDPPAQSSAPRGQKREREDVESSYDADELELVKKPARKKGRDRVYTFADPLCGGRKVGEEWDAGHVRYKVGPEGQRLRRGTIQQVRVKYQMPIDSHHQDHENTITVLVDKWYTEDQYNEAKEAGAFSWQDNMDDQVAAAVPTSTEIPANRSSSSFWDTPQVGDQRSSPARADSKASELNPFSKGRPSLGRLASSKMSPVPSVGASMKAQRVPSTKWQKAAKEQEALKKVQEMRAPKKKSSTPPAPLPTSTTPAPAPVFAAPVSVPSTIVPNGSGKSTEPAARLSVFPSTTFSTTTASSQPASNAPKPPTPPATTLDFASNPTSSTFASVFSPKPQQNTSAQPTNAGTSDPKPQSSATSSTSSPILPASIAPAPTLFNPFTKPITKPMFGSLASGNATNGVSAGGETANSTSVPANPAAPSGMFGLPAKPLGATTSFGGGSFGEEKGKTVEPPAAAPTSTFGGFGNPSAPKDVETKKDTADTTPSFGFKPPVSSAFAPVAPAAGNPAFGGFSAFAKKPENGTTAPSPSFAKPSTTDGPLGTPASLPAKPSAFRGGSSFSSAFGNVSGGFGQPPAPVSAFSFGGQGQKPDDKTPKPESSAPKFGASSFVSFGAGSPASSASASDSPTKALGQTSSIFGQPPAGHSSQSPAPTSEQDDPKPAMSTLVQGTPLFNSPNKWTAPSTTAPIFTLGPPSVKPAGTPLPRSRSTTARTRR